VDSPERADLAIVRTAAPWQQVHPNYVFGRMQHEGDLDFKPDNVDLIAIKELAARIPTIVTVYLERPAVLTGIRESATALLGNFGVGDEALLNVITGSAKPAGKLPFEMPSSVAATAAQKSDVPHDSQQPLYAIGYGLSF
jgi:beta-glucosidase